MNKEPYLEIDDIQGNILPGFRMPHQYFLALNPGDHPSGVLSYLLQRVTTMRQALDYNRERIERAKASGIFGLRSFALVDQPDRFWLNLGLGAAFLAAYNTEAQDIESSFKRGMARAAPLLGDPTDPADEGHPSRWKIGALDHPAALFCILASDSRELLLQRAGALKEDLVTRGAEVLYEEEGQRLEGDKEHFGFRDGISHPHVRGYVNEEGTEYLAKRYIIDTESGEEPEYSGPGDLLLWPGQFVFGYSRQDPSHFRRPKEPADREMSPFLRNGSFMVFRRLRQDVAGLYRAAERMAQEVRSLPGLENTGVEECLALLVGRQKDGTPLVWNGVQGSSDYFNHFLFKSPTKEVQLATGEILPPLEGDPTGFRCPMFAHIRKVNPRDLATDQGSETNTATFRTIRRGIPFGPPFDFTNPSNAVNQQERGLFFISYQTSIQRQFELLVSKWMNEPARPETNRGHDLLVGQNGEEGEGGLRWALVTNAAGQSCKVQMPSSFITTTGGGYFFCPSIRSLQWLVEHSASA